ncbi:MAG: glycosyltransferase family 2 protein [Akkermansia sp.]|nr:glycosyltransferase family 2 protein [Akkermansia sp.]
MEEKRNMPELQSAKSIVLITPAYNEEENIQAFVHEVKIHLSDYSWMVVIIDDGSSDNTWKEIERSAGEDKRVKGIRFSRNFGHQAAIKAGVEWASTIEADAYVMLDVDLQHPIDLVPQMVEMLNDEVHIVQGRRNDEGRKISFVKKFTSAMFYKVFTLLSGIRIEGGTSDFRALDRFALDFIINNIDKDAFLRGMLPWSGLQTEELCYFPKERVNGVSKFTMRKMCNLAMSGIIGYSTRPLYISLVLGSLCLLLSLMYFAYVVIILAIGKETAIGWASTIACILGLGGTQLLILGIMGIYLGKMFTELKPRPAYVISQTV